MLDGGTLRISTRSEAFTLPQGFEPSRTLLSYLNQGASSGTNLAFLLAPKGDRLHPQLWTLKTDDGQTSLKTLTLPDAQGQPTHLGLSSDGSTLYSYSNYGAFTGTDLR